MGRKEKMERERRESERRTRDREANAKRKERARRRMKKKKKDWSDSEDEGAGSAAAMSEAERADMDALAKIDFEGEMESVGDVKPEDVENFMFREDVNPVEEAGGGRSQVISVLTKAVVLEHCRKFRRKVGQSKIHLDFSSPEFNLISLEGLIYVDQPVSELRLSSNSIVLLDATSHLTDLKRLFVNHNYLDGVLRLGFPNLQVLDLSYNRLGSVPHLDCPRLEVLRLDNNAIAGDWFVLEQCPLLRELHMANNAMDWGTAQFSRNMATLKGLKKLEVLDLTGCPIRAIPGYKLMILANSVRLSRLDGIDITKRDRAGKEEYADNISEGAFSAVSRPSTISTRAALNPERYRPQQIYASLGESMHTVASLIDIIRDMQGQPARCIPGMRQLQASIDAIVSQHEPRAIFDGLISPHLLIEDLLENVVIFMEAQPTFTAPMIRAISRLVAVADEGLGRKCLELLLDLMDTVPQYRRRVMDSLLAVVMPEIESPHASKAGRRVLLSALAKLSTHDDVADSMFSAIPTLAGWLYKEVSATKSASEELLQVLASISRTRRNALEFRENRILKITQDLLEHMENMSTTAYVSLLQIVERTSRVDDAIAERFSRDGVQKELIHIVRSFRQSATSWTDARSFWGGQVVRTLAALCASPLCFREAIDGGFLDRMCQIIFWQNVHPLLLAPVCDAIAHVLTIVSTHRDKDVEAIQRGETYADEQDLGDDEDDIDEFGKARRMSWRRMYTKLLTKVTASLNSCIPLLSYFQGRRYQAMCRTLDLISDRNEVMPLHTQDNKGICDVLVGVLRIMTFYHRRMRHHADDMCREVCQALDENNREQYLFALLGVPSDDVKIGVADVLVLVGRNLEYDEICEVVRIVSDCEDITVGRMEEVIARCFLIMTEFVTLDTPGGEQYRAEHAVTVMKALDVMARNCARDTKDDPEEAHDKAVLMRACVSYLRCTEQWHEALPVLHSRDATMAMQAILKYEEMYGTYAELMGEEEDPPVWIETTDVAHNIESLLGCLGVLQLNSPVGGRVLDRISHWLEGEALQAIAAGKGGGSSGSGSGSGKGGGSVTSGTSGTLGTTAASDTASDTASVRSVPADADDGSDHPVLRKRKASQQQEFFYEEAHLREHRLRQHDEFLRLGGVGKVIAMLLETHDLRHMSMFRAKDLMVRAQVVANEEENAMMLSRGMRGKTGMERPWFTLSEDHASLFQRMEEELGRSARVNVDAIGPGVAAVLRLLCAGAWYGTLQQRSAFAAELRNPDHFRALALLCYRMDWLPYSVGVLLLALLEEITKVPLDRTDEDVGVLIGYDSISQVLQSVLYYCAKHMSGRRFLLPKQELLLYYAASLCRVLCRQVQSIHFSHDPRIDRTVQQMVVVSMLPMHVLKMLLLVLFRDAYRMAKRECESPAALRRRSECREMVFQTFSEYLVLCEEIHYDLWEAVHRMEASERTVLRPAWIIRILDLFAHRWYHRKLEQLLNAHGVTPDVERVIEWSDVRLTLPSGATPFLLVVTNAAFYILRRPDTPMRADNREHFALPQVLQRNAFDDVHHLQLSFDEMHFRAGSSVLLFSDPTLARQLFDVFFQRCPNLDEVDRVDKFSKRLLRFKINSHQPNGGRNMYGETLAPERILTYSKVQLINRKGEASDEYRMVVFTDEAVYSFFEDPRYWRAAGDAAMRYLLLDVRVEHFTLDPHVVFSPTRPEVLLSFDMADLHVLLPSWEMYDLWRKIVQRVLRGRRR